MTAHPNPNRRPLILGAVVVAVLAIVVAALVIRPFAGAVATPAPATPAASAFGCTVRRRGDPGRDHGPDCGARRGRARSLTTGARREDQRDGPPPRQPR